MLSLKRRIDCLISLLLVASMPVMAEEPLSPLPQLPAESATIVNKERTWNLQDADIKTVVEQVSRETGKNFILDPKVSGTISIISNQPISPDEVYQVFLAALQVLGFAAVDEGSVIKIVPDASAKFMNTPIGSGVGDSMEVRIIPVQFVNAAGLVPVLRNLISPQGHLAAYPGSNVLIAADRAGTVNRLAEIVERIDVEDTDGVDHIVLQHATASEVVQVVNNLTAANRRPNEPQQSNVVLSADDRSNTILLSGDKKRRLQLRALIAQLDVPADNVGNTEVIYLKYQKAEDMVPVLSNIISSYHGAANGGTGGQQALPPMRNNTAVNVDVQRSTTPDVVGSDGGYNSDLASDRGSSLGQSGNRQALGTVIGGYGVQAEPNMNALIISAPPSLMRSLKTVINRLDVRRAQVLIEAIIVELSHDVSEELGVEWRGGGDTYGGFTGTNPIIDTVQQTLIKGDVAALPGGLNVGYIKDGSLRFLLRALNSESDSNILATPSVLALDNSQAVIFVGQTVPYTSGEYITDGTSNNAPFKTTAFKEVGLSLAVIPQITQDKAIHLAIEQIVDNILRFDVNNQPVTANRAINTTVLVNDGDILVLGGLIQTQEQDAEEGVPFLSDIPGVGFLLNNTSKNVQKTNLMIFLRPTIIREPEQGIKVTGAKYNFMRDTLLAEEDTEIELPEFEDGVMRKKIILPLPFVALDQNQAQSLEEYIDSRPERLD